MSTYQSLKLKNNILEMLKQDMLKRTNQSVSLSSFRWDGLTF